jgi:hypothetical protein
MLSWLYFQMNMENYPHITLTEDGRLVSTGQHRPGFPRVLNDTLCRLGYNGDDPLYYCCLSTAHGLDVWEVTLTVPFNPMDPWMGTIVGSELNSTIEQMALVVLPSLCENCLTGASPKGRARRPPRAPKILGPHLNSMCNNNNNS